jgi:beta-mannosidase
MDLSGPWRATVADEHLRRTFAEPDHDDEGWAPISVPGHWRSNPAFAATDGPLLYRHRFEHDEPGPDTRTWLRFEGVFYQSDVWLDGNYVGNMEGYFFDHTFEVTDALATRREHALAVEVACAAEADRSAKRNLTGTFQHSDALDPGWNPGGIWRPVTIEHTGPVRIRGLNVATVEASPEQARVRCRAVLDASRAETVKLVTTVGDADEHVEITPVAAGDNLIEWTVVVDDPRLWWPRVLGDQPLYDITVDALIDGRSSHRRGRRTGLRAVTLRNWILSVNGERLFAKGALQGPARHALADATPDELRADVDRAVEAGLDLIRLHAHITRPEFYEAADEAGLLIWQDLPLIRGYARGVRKQAALQARKAVETVGHHPSVVIWCGHDEPLALEEAPGEVSGPEELKATTGRAVALQQLPSWNKTVLDRTVKRATEAADGTRPVIAHSGVWPHPPLLDGTDSHLWFGWLYGRATDLAGFASRLPRMVRWVGAFGAQSVPESLAVPDEDRWPDLDWDELESRHGLQRGFLVQHVDPADHPTFDAWRAATQDHQANVVRTQIEVLRRLKYRPTGGFCLSSFADGSPAISTSVLDSERRPKAAHGALVAACRPVIVMADRLPPTVRTGDRVDLLVHAVSDLRRSLLGTRVTAVLAWPGGRRTWGWQGDLPADSCAAIGHIEAPVPMTASGPLTLELRLVADDPDGGTIDVVRLDESRIRSD